MLRATSAKMRLDRSVAQYGCLMATALSLSPSAHRLRPSHHGAFDSPAFHLTRQRPYHSASVLHAKKKTKSRHSDEKATVGEILSDESLEATASFASNYHAPVMAVECIQSLLNCQRTKDRVFADGTLGGGGHSLALLQSLSPGDVLFGCDVDPDALETASQRLSEYMDHDSTEKPLFVPVQSNFCDLHSALTTHPITNDSLEGGIDGILMDLGVSSYQINTAERGFAFMKEGPLDMRMGQVGGMTAADVCNEFTEDELKRIFKVYGDEPRCKSIAGSIVQHRPLSTTQDLVNAVADVVPEFAKKGRRMGRTATLARVFQSLRIVVNQEDAVLDKALTQMCPTLIRTGGRLVILSYHSMEDRAAKRIMRDGTLSGRPNDERDMYGNYIGTPRPWKTVGKRQRARDEEIELNPRARSAMLRVAERADDKTTG